MEYLEQLTPGDVVDLVCLGIAIILVIRGAIRGISGELSHILANVIVLIAAIYGYRPAMAMMIEHVEQASNPLVLHVVLACVFVVVGALVAWVLRVVLRRSLRVIVTPPTDWFLGMLCGVVGSAVLVLVAFLVVSMVPNVPFRRIVSTESRVGRLVSPMVAPVADQLVMLPHVAATTNTLDEIQSRLADKITAAAAQSVSTNTPSAQPPASAGGSSAGQ